MYPDSTSNGPVFGGEYVPYFYQSGLFLAYDLPQEAGQKEYFIIPMKDERKLIVPVESKGPRKLWDGKQNRPVEL